MIHKLSKQVINKIAAGEVVQRPYNALKQLIQNSIDAGATMIHIKIQDGGMKKMEIKDNGKGILVEDYPLLCERYATSKIKKVSDLQSIDSFGFRGEALASLTHVGDVQVVSRHENRKQAYFAKFDQEKLVGNPIPVRRQIGTTITVQNMFSTLASRRKSLIPNEQKKKIKELIYEMALDNPHIQFILATQKGEQVMINYQNQPADEARIKIFCQLTGILKYHCLLARTTIGSASVLGIFSKVNTWDKWRSVTATINHRIVESPELEKVIQKAYDQANRTIHKQNYSYCCYLNLEIDPKTIDCNVHPTKKQVTFYKAGDLFFDMLKWMENLLQESGTVKFIDSGARMSQHSLNQLREKFQQKVLIGQSSMMMGKSQQQMEGGRKNQNSQNNQATNQSYIEPGQLSFQLQKTQYAFNKTRTDSKQLPLQYFYKNLFSSSPDSQEKEQFQQQRFVFKNFVDHYQENQQNKQMNELKNFFLSVTYVGCLNVSHIFVQIENKLYCMEISHFVKVYVREMLKENRSLVLKNVENQKIRVPSIIDGFLLKHQSVISREKLQRIYKTTLEQLSFNRDFLQQRYGIKCNEFLDIQSYPIISKCFASQPLHQDSLAYFLINLFASSQLQHKSPLSLLYLQFLCNPFQAIDTSIYQISPQTDKYDSFFNNEFIPTLKMKGKFYFEEFNEIDITDLLSEMMDLKDAYRTFQRC